jgi:hypothetical protein
MQIKQGDVGIREDAPDIVLMKGTPADFYS